MVEWEEQQGILFWSPEKENEFLEGVVINEILPTKENFGRQLEIETSDKKVYRTPSHKVLQNRLSKVKIGDVVKIVLTGYESPSKKGQNPTTMYKVYIARV